MRETIWIFETCFKVLTGCEIFIKVLTMYVLHDILITVADAETQKTTKRNEKLS